jgi:hypothetical protein
MILIYDLDLSSLTNLLKEWNEPAYRAKQIWQGTVPASLQLARAVYEFAQISARENGRKLNLHAILSEKVYQDSSDKHTRKTLFELPDTNLIEAVLMRYGDPADTHDGNPIPEQPNRAARFASPLRQAAPWDVFSVPLVNWASNVISPVERSWRR